MLWIVFAIGVLFFILGFVFFFVPDKVAYLNRRTHRVVTDGSFTIKYHRTFGVLLLALAVLLFVLHLLFNL